MVALDVIDNLYDRTIILARIVEHHRMAVLYDGEPLPVGVHLRGETPKDRMLRICQDA